MLDAHDGDDDHSRSRRWWLGNLAKGQLTTDPLVVALDGVEESDESWNGYHDHPGSAGELRKEKHDTGNSRCNGSEAIERRPPPPTGRRIWRTRWRRRRTQIPAIASSSSASGRMPLVPRTEPVSPGWGRRRPVPGDERDKIRARQAVNRTRSSRPTSQVATHELKLKPSFQGAWKIQTRSVSDCGFMLHMRKCSACRTMAEAWRPCAPISSSSNFPQLPLRCVRVSPRDQARLLGGAARRHPAQPHGFRFAAVAGARRSLVVNDTRVIAAQLEGRLADAEPKVEATLIKRLDGSRWQALTPCRRAGLATISSAIEGEESLPRRVDAQVGARATRSGSWSRDLQALGAAIAAFGAPPLHADLAQSALPTSAITDYRAALFAANEGAVEARRPAGLAASKLQTALRARGAGARGTLVSSAAPSRPATPPGAGAAREWGVISRGCRLTRSTGQGPRRPRRREVAALVAAVEAPRGGRRRRPGRARSHHAGLWLPSMLLLAEAPSAALSTVRARLRLIDHGRRYTHAVQQPACPSSGDACLLFRDKSARSPRPGQTSNCST